MVSTEIRLVPATIRCAAVIISLIVMASAAEGRRCYWCGPLADQVHRSQRAPPCAGDNAQVTVCDAGLPHCAVVAKFPPYIESRYCVKFYQDECYPLYCNSTKTWRMTCPCQGDLCNGPNSQRESEAFEILTKLVAKTNSARFKRALNSTENDEMSEGNDTVAVTVTTATNVNDNNVQDDSSEKANLNETTFMENNLLAPTDMIKLRNDSVNNNHSKNDVLMTKETTTPQTESNDTITQTKDIETNRDEMILTEKKIEQNKPKPTPVVMQRDETTTAKLNTDTTIEMTTMKNNIPNMRGNNTATRMDIHLIALAVGTILNY